MNILNYIKGTRKGKEAKNFEEKLMRDPFLAEAMEGYEQVKGNHDIIIARLRQKVLKKTSRKKFRHPMFIWSSIVAAVAVIAIVAVFFLGGFHLYFQDQKQFVVTDNKAVKLIPMTDSSQSIVDKSADAMNSDSSKTVNKTELSTKKFIAKTFSEKPSSRYQRSKSKVKGRTFIASAREKTIPDTANYSASYNTSLSKQVTPEFMEVSGTVKDDKGTPMIGVKINTGSLQGVYTDSQGKFSLKNVLEGQKVTFSYIGFKTKEVVVEGTTNQILDVTMLENDESLAEQVIIDKDHWRKSKPKRNEQKAAPFSGFESYQKYIEKNKQLSSDNECKGKNGKIKIVFSTDKNGRPYNIRVVQGLCPEYDSQAIGLINNGEAWTANCKRVEYEIKF